MHHQILMVVIAFAISSSAFAKASREPTRIEPTTPWQMKYAEDLCQLTREFGEGDQKVRLVFDQYGPGEEFRLTVIGKLLRGATNQKQASLTFGPLEKEQKLLFYKAKSNGIAAFLFPGGGRIASPDDAELAANKKNGAENWVPFSPVSSEREAAVRYLLIGKPLATPVLLETGSLKTPLASLDKCADAMVEAWGIDAQKHRALTRSVTPNNNPGDWLNWSDYPSNMVRARQPALIAFRLIVGTDGTPTACSIQSTTGGKEFDDAVCKSVMQRARFDPALDADGKPIVSYYQNRVRFSIP